VPLKTYRGASVGPLLAQAQAELGADAVVIKVEGAAGQLELMAADPETASALAALAPARGAPSGRVVREAPAAKTEAPRPVATAPIGRSSAPATPRPAAPRAPAPPSAHSPHILAFVGPTGAGKTTTVAKLAAHPRVFEGRRVGLLNLDTYRVGAAEQLAAYAELEQVKLATAYEPNDLWRALDQLKGSEIILVDCPGRGARTQQDHDAVVRILASLQPAETHLVLPVGMQPELVRRTIEHHRRLGVTHLLASKVDEMPDDWILFDIAVALGLPMRWLSDGQRVPQDIRAATARLDAARGSARARRPRRQESVA
jgi:flagellar biosynthesis protein FlhF